MSAPNSAAIFAAASAEPLSAPIHGKVLPINVMTRVHTERFEDRWARMQNGRVERVLQLVPVEHVIVNTHYIDENGDMQ